MSDLFYFNLVTFIFVVLFGGVGRMKLVSFWGFCCGIPDAIQIYKGIHIPPSFYVIFFNYS